MPHTPGPWYADWNVVVDAADTTIGVARAGVGIQSVEVAISNARLFAASPGMFTALLHIAQILEKPKLSERDHHDLRAIAQIAIHKTVMGGK